MPTLRQQPIAVVSVCLLAAALTGCARNIDSAEAIARVNESNIQRLANLYFTYQMKHEWQGPAHEQAFKDFIRGFNPEKLRRVGVDPAAIDATFVSERDGQPFKIRYGVAGSSRGSSEPVIFEATGEDGKRLVGFLNMEQREVDETEYDSLWAGAGARPQG